ncbi:unnamed protein product [Acanthosepion pharaonis]|uniref:Uncharacterized protein n=1 Tax=Acanthosepion pharaonis TaxID=158019 RepID=A0A812CIL9_ACAPH|nr:unnamed protein product [Sepia pharaonis]
MTSSIVYRKSVNHSPSSFTHNAPSPLYFFLYFSSLSFLFIHFSRFLLSFIFFFILVYIYPFLFFISAILSLLISFPYCFFHFFYSLSSFHLTFTLNSFFLSLQSSFFLVISLLASPSGFLSLIFSVVSSIRLFISFFHSHLFSPIFLCLLYQPYISHSFF